jgi:hypothetical protein
MTAKELDIKASDFKGWASLRLVAAICNEDKEKLSKLAKSLTDNFTSEEILQIWKQVKMLLTKSEVAWLEGTLNQLIQQQTNE